MKGELLYKVTALQQLFRFRGFECEVAARSAGSLRGKHLMLTVSNGCFFGGGFPIAPGGSVSDGRLHACVIADAPPLSRLRLFNLAERGRHVRSERVQILSDVALRLTFAAPPRFEMDGDLRLSEGASVEVSVRPAALAVVAPTA